MIALACLRFQTPLYFPRQRRLARQPRLRGLLALLALALLLNSWLPPVSAAPMTLSSHLSGEGKGETLRYAAPAPLTPVQVPSRLAGIAINLPAPASASAALHAAAPARDPQDWQNWPVIPTLGKRMLAVYQQGLALGNNPRAFSKIGDGEISALWFLTEFDLGPQYYDLGPYTNLQSTIQAFAGSFGRASMAARRGFNTTRILDAALADPALCNPGETPLECELRLQRPSFALVSLGTNQVWQPEVLEPELRQIIETLLAHNVVPVLSTKADNLEGDCRINAIIASLAAEYEVPLWNFWRAVQDLPDHGLQADLEHLTYAPNHFGDSVAMQHSWPLRNLTALQVLDALWQQTHTGGSR